jgi:hypothetical protein
MANETPTPQTPEFPLSSEYLQTARRIVDTLGDFSMEVRNNALAQNNAMARFRGWTTEPLFPNGGWGAQREGYRAGEYESIFVDTGQKVPQDHIHRPPYAASYSHSARVPESAVAKTISDIMVDHEGGIWTRDYIYPPVDSSGGLGNLSEEPPYERVADDPEALALVEDSIKNAVA